MAGFLKSRLKVESNSGGDEYGVSIKQVGSKWNWKLVDKKNKADIDSGSENEGFEALKAATAAMIRYRRQGTKTK